MKCFKTYQLFVVISLFILSCSGDSDNNADPDKDGTVLPVNAAAELTANDLSPHPMQDIPRPGYLKTIVDPSFGTIIRRISDGTVGGVIKPMYSTIQAWNADESRMILYNQTNGVHQLLDGMDYTFIRNLSDVNPDDLEQLFWDFNAPDILYYLDSTTHDFTKYSVSSKNKEVLVNLKDLIGCSGNISMGNDVQMMSWDSDVIGFRCDNNQAYSYRLSTKKLTTFNIDNISYTAPMPAPSGNLFFHATSSYDSEGNLKAKMNKSSVEHSCLGKFANGTDADFSVTFEEGPNGGCLGNIIAYDLTTGDCIPIISQSLGYDYPKSGTHISAVAHKNPGWIAASMIGYKGDGQSLLDQELVIAHVELGNIEVFRIGHHRADENEFDYWGEPHAVISPTGTRVLFGSDWSGTDDGKSVESYVVELPAFVK